MLATGLGTCGLFLVVAGQAETFWQLYVLLFLAGAAGASVNAATGRAVMGWFDAAQRGLALGIRQAAVPLGGLVGAFVLPQLTVHHAYAFLGCLCLLGATAGAIFLREPSALPVEVADVEWTLRDHRLWRLCAVAGLYVVAQMAILSFVVLYLHDERSLSKGQAAAVLGAVQVAAMVLRVGAGQWSDKLRTRDRPARSNRDRDERRARRRRPACWTRRCSCSSRPSSSPASLTMAWNGVASPPSPSSAGRARSGAALGVQQTVLSLAGVAAPVAFAAVVSSARGASPTGGGVVPACRLARASDVASAPVAARLCVRILDRLDELAALGDRIGYSPEEDAAHELAAGWFREAGLEVEVDAAGNLIGRIPGGDARGLDGLAPRHRSGRAAASTGRSASSPGSRRSSGSARPVSASSSSATRSAAAPGSRACVASRRAARRLRRAAHRAGPAARCARTRRSAS